MRQALLSMSSVCVPCLKPVVWQRLWVSRYSIQNLKLHGKTGISINNPSLAQMLLSLESPIAKILKDNNIEKSLKLKKKLLDNIEDTQNPKTKIPSLNLLPFLFLYINLSLSLYIKFSTLASDWKQYKVLIPSSSPFCMDASRYFRLFHSHRYKYIYKGVYC